MISTASSISRHVQTLLIGIHII